MGIKSGVCGCLTMLGCLLTNGEVLLLLLLLLLLLIPFQAPGDGRELVVMLPDAVKVSAEDGRRVEVGGPTLELSLPMGSK
jgi:hypothetical protein